MKLIASGDVQYIAAYFTSKKTALCGDRKTKSKSDPIFNLFQDDINQQIIIEITDVLAEDMYSNPKERLDIYILKEPSNLLLKGLEILIPEITKAIILDRANRDAKDSRFVYDASGLPLRIDAVEGWVKLNKVSASLTEKGISISCLSQARGDLPKLNIDVEHTRTRMHFGIEANWVQSNQVDSSSNITLIIPWSELAHLIGAIRTAIPKLS